MTDAASSDLRDTRLNPTRPQTAEALYQLGNLFRQAQRDSEAEDCYRRALSAKHDLWSAYQNLGNLLQDRGSFEEAAKCYRKALLGNPNHPDAHLGLAFVELVRGNWTEGWLEYEYRFAKYERALRRLNLRRLNRFHWEKGLSGCTVLLHGEQGLGDTIQFARYAAM